MANIEGIIDGLRGVGTDGWEAIKTIANFLNYLIHPSLIIKALWNFTVVYSFWICLFIALLSVILYAFGFKRFAKYAPSSLALYTLIKMLAGVF